MSGGNDKPIISKEQAHARREEIIAACESLYQTMGFKAITLKVIADYTSFHSEFSLKFFQKLLNKHMVQLNYTRIVRIGQEMVRALEILKFCCSEWEGLTLNWLYPRGFPLWSFRDKMVSNG